MTRRNLASWAWSGSPLTTRKRSWLVDHWWSFSLAFGCGLREVEIGWVIPFFKLKPFIPLVTNDYLNHVWSGGGQAILVIMIALRCTSVIVLWYETYNNCRRMRVRIQSQNSSNRKQLLPTCAKVCLQRVIKNRKCFHILCRVCSSAQEAGRLRRHEETVGIAEQRVRSSCWWTQQVGGMYFTQAY